MVSLHLKHYNQSPRQYLMGVDDIKIVDWLHTVSIFSINKTIPIRIDLPSRRPPNIKKAQPVGKNSTYSISFTCIIPNRKIFQVAINCHSGIPFRHQFTPVSGAVAKGLFWTSTCNGQGTSICNSRSPCHCR